MSVRCRARAITKRFGATVALDDVTLELEAGRVRVLLGANGAGKSTLLHVLGGTHRADSGTLELDGAPFAPRSPLDARRAGVVIVAQEPAIVPELSVEANVLLGAERARFGFVRGTEHASLASAALARVGHGSLDLRRRAGDLPLALRQVVVIARALVLEARVVVLDEPTSALSAADAAHVVSSVRELAAAGVAVLYVTHFLDEVARAGDTYTVLRDGRVAADGDARRVTIAELAAHVSGQPASEPEPRAERELGDVVLSITGLSGRESPLEIDLFVRRGEVLGLAGLTGSGRGELLRAILGADERARGSVRMGAGPLAPGARAGVRAGLGLLAGDRASNLFPGRPVADQVVLSNLGPLTTGGFARTRRVLDAVRSALARVAAPHVEPGRSIDVLSGGTQQRVALARLVHQSPDVLLLEEPMRGVDVAAKRDIRRLVDELARGGRSVIISSSSEEELLELCDTIAVMRQGRIVATRSASAWSRSDLVRCAAEGGEAA